MSESSSSVVQAHVLNFDSVPRQVMEKLFYASIAVAWAFDRCEIVGEDEESDDALMDLLQAVSEAENSSVVTP